MLLGPIFERFATQRLGTGGVGRDGSLFNGPAAIAEKGDLWLADRNFCVRW